MPMYFRPRHERLRIQRERQRVAASLANHEVRHEQDELVEELDEDGRLAV